MNQQTHHTEFRLDLRGEAYASRVEGHGYCFCGGCGERLASPSDCFPEVLVREDGSGWLPFDILCRDCASEGNLKVVHEG